MDPLSGDTSLYHSFPATFKDSALEDRSFWSSLPSLYDHLCHCFYCVFQHRSIAFADLSVPLQDHCCLQFLHCSLCCLRSFCFHGHFPMEGKATYYRETTSVSFFYNNRYTVHPNDLYPLRFTLSAPSLRKFQ